MLSISPVVLKAHLFSAMQRRLHLCVFVSILNLFLRPSLALSLSLSVSLFVTLSLYHSVVDVNFLSQYLSCFSYVAHTQQKDFRPLCVMAIQGMPNAFLIVVVKRPGCVKRVVRERMTQILQLVKEMEKLLVHCRKYVTLHTCS